MREFRFYKEKNGTWWIDLDGYVAQGGNPADLQMVAGADDFLDFLSEDKEEMKLQISEQKISTYPNPFYELKRVDEIPTISGRYYFDTESETLMWLCSVTLWLFEGRYPETIYYKPV